MCFWGFAHFVPTFSSLCLLCWSLVGLWGFVPSLVGVGMLCLAGDHFYASLYVLGICCAVFVGSTVTWGSGSLVWFLGLIVVICWFVGFLHLTCSGLDVMFLAGDPYCVGLYVLGIYCVGLVGLAVTWSSSSHVWILSLFTVTWGFFFYFCESSTCWFSWFWYTFLCLMALAALWFVHLFFYFSIFSVGWWWFSRVEGILTCCYFLWFYWVVFGSSFSLSVFEFCISTVLVVIFYCCNPLDIVGYFQLVLSISMAINGDVCAGIFQNHNVSFVPPLSWLVENLVDTLVVSYNFWYLEEAVTLLECLNAYGLTCILVFPSICCILFIFSLHDFFSCSWWFCCEEGPRFGLMCFLFYYFLGALEWAL